MVDPSAMFHSQVHGPVLLKRVVLKRSALLSWQRGVPRPPQPIAAHGGFAAVCSRARSVRSHGRRDRRSRTTHNDLARFHRSPLAITRRSTARATAHRLLVSSDTQGRRVDVAKTTANRETNRSADGNCGSGDEPRANRTYAISSSSSSSGWRTRSTTSLIRITSPTARTQR